MEAKLDREVLSTDPVPNTSSPLFEQELAWEVDRASLREFRLQRASVKLRIFSLESVCAASSREHLGYVILDVRSATERRTFRWFQLLNSKTKPCPELYCGLYIDSCGTNNPEVRADFNPMPLDVERLVKEFENQLIDGFQLGDANSAQEFFLVSVFPISIPHLSNLLPPNLLPSSNFKLILHFLNNEVASWEFNEKDCIKLAANQCKFFIRLVIKLCTSQLLDQRWIQLKTTFCKQILLASHF